MSAVLKPIRELWNYRDLVSNLVTRDLKARYRNSVLGFLWCLLSPLGMMLVFTVVFTVLMNSAIPKFPVFVLIGILAWNLHSNSMAGATNSVLDNAALVKKVYFPREVLPISSVLANLVNFLLSLLVLIPLLIVFQIHLSASVVFLPVVILTQFLFSAGVGMFLGATMVYYRDVGIIMETITLAWFFLTPIFYRLEDLFPQYARLVYIANPMASIISAYRDILYHGGWPGIDFLSRTFVTALVIFIAGFLYFRRLSRAFGEEL